MGKRLAFLLVGLAISGAACTGGALSPTPSLDAAATATAMALAAPTDTPTPPATRTPTPTPGTPLPTPTIPGVVDAPPPFAIDLPEAWQAQYNQLAIVRPDGAELPLKVAFFSGPTPAGAAVVTVLWDYEAVYSDVWRDGIELVQVVFDPSCQFSLAGAPPEPETFTVGLHYAEGIRYQVANCEEAPDAAGWLVGYRRAEVNYLLYVWFLPPAAAEADAAFVQAILDTIRFPGED